MAETRLDVFENAVGLLLRHGYQARAEPAYRPPGAQGPVVAIVTDAPPVILGYAISQVAADPEPHLPTTSAKVPKARPTDPGAPQHAWWP
jgi:hypothetical protein